MLRPGLISDKDTSRKSCRAELSTRGTSIRRQPPTTSGAAPSTPRAARVVKPPNSAARCDVVLSRTGCHVFAKRNPAPEISMVCFQRGARRKAEGVTKIGKSVTFLSRLLSRRADGGRLAQVFSTRRRRLNRARGRDCHENCPKRHVRVPDSVTVPTERRTGRPKRLLTGLGPCGLARLGHGVATANSVRLAQSRRAAPD